MNLTSLRNAVTSSLGRKALLGKKHAPVILFALGTVGVVGAAILACRATLRVSEVLDEVDANVEAAKELRDGKLEGYGEAEYKKEVSKLYFAAGAKIARMYAPAVIVGAASIAALTGSHVMLNKRYAQAAAAYAALDAGFKQYRERVIAKLGKDKDLEFRHGIQEMEIVEEGPNGPEIKTIKRADAKVPSIYARWFDEGSHAFEREGMGNFLFLRAQQADWNRRLQQDGYVMLNDVLYKLGIPRCPEGQLVGWVKDSDKTGKGDGFIDFGIFQDDSEQARDFMNGSNKSVLLDFNVDGIVFELISKHEPR